MQSLAKLCVLLSLFLPFSTNGADMSDYQAIEKTINQYFNGLKNADRKMLESAFMVEKGHMKGYLNGTTEKKELTSRPMSEVIDDWASRDPNPNLKGEIISVNIYSDVAATALFNFNDIFIDSFQLAKTDDGWKIVNKYYIDK